MYERQREKINVRMRDRYSDEKLSASCHRKLNF